MKLYDGDGEPLPNQYCSGIHRSVRSIPLNTIPSVAEMWIFYKGLHDNLKDKVSGKDYEMLKELQALAMKYDIRIQERNTECSLKQTQ